jgi:hypothetical protein
MCRQKAGSLKPLVPKLGQAPKKKPLAVLNRDDRFYDYFMSITHADIITYGFSEEADVRAEDPVTGP